MKSNKTRLALRGVVLATAVWFGSVSFAQAGTDSKDVKTVKESDVKDAEGFKKPEWLKEVSIAVKESYDSNVYMANPGGALTSFTNNEPVRQSSWITTVTPTVGFEFVSLLGLDKGDKGIQSLGLSYAPEIATYHDIATENYINHKIAFQIKGRPTDTFTYGTTNTFNYIDGQKDSLFVANGATNQISPTSSGSFRERRDQFQDKFKGFIRQELSDDYFIRGVAEGAWYDLHVNQYTASTYVNFPDRYDANTGIDLGWKANPLTGVSSVKGLSNDYALFLGYRVGKTYQGVTPPTTAHYTSTYQRVLAGIEGQPFSALKLNFMIGPDFRDYEGGYAPTAGGGAFQSVGSTIYFEGSAVYTITKQDSLQGKAKQYEWVASTGNGVYTDRSYEIQYVRKITDALTGTLGYRYVQGDYTSNGNDDNLYITSVGLGYKLNDNWSFNTDYSWKQSISDNNTSGGAFAREGEGHVVSFGATWSL